MSPIHPCVCVCRLLATLDELALPTSELIAESQRDSSGPTHRDGFVPLRVVRIEFGPCVAQIFSVDLDEPRVLSDTERPIVRCESGQVVSNRVVLQVR